VDKPFTVNKISYPLSAGSRRAKIMQHACESCGKQIIFYASEYSPGRFRFCSWACRTQSMVGENAPNFGKGEKMRGFRDGIL
jgi:hypothetical protein